MAESERLTPKLRDDVAVAHEAGEADTQVVLQGAGGRSVRLLGDEYALLRRLDGRATLDDVCRAVAAAGAPALAPPAFAVLLDQLAEAGLVEGWPSGAAVAGRRRPSAALGAEPTALSQEATAAADVAPGAAAGAGAATARPPTAPPPPEANAMPKPARVAAAARPAVLAPPSRVPYRALGALLLGLSAVALAALWHYLGQPELPRVRTRTLEPVRHVVLEGSAALAARPLRSASVTASVAGELQWLAQPRSNVAAQAVVARLQPKVAATATPALAAADARVRRAEAAAAAAGQLVQDLAHRRGDRLPRRQQQALLRGLTAARLQAQRAQVRLHAAQADHAALAQAHPTSAAQPLELRAPFAATVTEVRGQLGGQVAAGASLVQLVDRSSVRLRLWAPPGSTYAVGSKVLVAVDVGSPSEREGRVVEVHREAGRPVLEVEVADPKLGLPVNVSGQSFHLVRDVVASACFVPNEALACSKASCTLWQLVDGRAQAREVRVVQPVSDGAWVAWTPRPAGREPPLILGGSAMPLAKLRPGLAVQPTVP